MVARISAYQRKVTFVDDSDPYAEELEASMRSADTPLSDQCSSVWATNGTYQSSSIDTQTQGLDALSAAATRDSYPLQPPVSVPVDPTMGRSNISFNQPDISMALASIASPDHARNSMPAPASPSTSISSSNNNINFL